MTTETSTANMVEMLQKALEMLVTSSLYDTQRHLYYCLSNRLAAVIRALRDKQRNE